MYLQSVLIWFQRLHPWACVYWRLHLQIRLPCQWFGSVSCIPPAWWLLSWLGGLNTPLRRSSFCKCTLSAKQMDLRPSAPLAEKQRLELPGRMCPGEPQYCSLWRGFVSMSKKELQQLEWNPCCSSSAAGFMILIALCLRLSRVWGIATCSGL